MVLEIKETKTSCYFYLKLTNTFESADVSQLWKHVFRDVFIDGEDRFTEEFDQLSKDQQLWCVKILLRNDPVEVNVVYGPKGRVMVGGQHDLERLKDIIYIISRKVTRRHPLKGVDISHAHFDFFVTLNNDFEFDIGKIDAEFKSDPNVFNGDKINRIYLEKQVISGNWFANHLAFNRGFCYAHFDTDPPKNPNHIIEEIAESREHIIVCLHQFIKPYIKLNKESNENIKVNANIVNLSNSV